jgi:hypothetical protein
VHLAPASRFANINSEEVEIEPVLEVAEIEPGTEGHPQEGDVRDRHLNRAEEELKRLNAEQDIKLKKVLTEQSQIYIRTCRVRKGYRRDTTFFDVIIL